MSKSTNNCIQTLDIKKMVEYITKQTNINISHFLQQTPIKSNYTIEISYSIFYGKICSVLSVSTFRPTNKTIQEHISLHNLSYGCFVELTETQMQLFKEYNNMTIHPTPSQTLLSL